MIWGKREAEYFLGRGLDCKRQLDPCVTVRGIFSPAAYDGSTAPCASIVVVTAKTDRYRFCYIPLGQPRLFGAIEKGDDYGSSAVLKPRRDHLR